MRTEKTLPLKRFRFISIFFQGVCQSSNGALETLIILYRLSNHLIKTELFTVTLQSFTDNVHEDISLTRKMLMINIIFLRFEHSYMALMALKCWYFVWDLKKWNKSNPRSAFFSLKYRIMNTYVRPFHKDSSFGIQLKCQLATLENMYKCWPKG